MESNYKFLGCNDDQDFCSCCGKQGLKKVIWLENLQTGEINHFGTTCAALNLVGKKEKSNIKIDEIALTELRAIVESAIEKNWNIAQSSRIEFENAVAVDLINAGVERNFEYLAGKTDAFCNFIWPYQRRLKRINYN
ncbi:MAG: hypothetical protein IPN33_25035 [Saprospiraceae bacterium]|nr:hypothetical protein [Saprospiraceae bacterium]